MLRLIRSPQAGVRHTCLTRQGPRRDHWCNVPSVTLPLSPPPASAGHPEVLRAPVPEQHHGPGLSPQQAAWLLVLPHHPRLVRLATACGSSADDAHDIAQDALMRAVAMDALDPDRVGALLSTIVRRLVIDAARGQALQTRLHQDRRLALPDTAGPEDSVCDAAQAAWLLQALDLQPREATVVHGLAAGRSTADSARELGCTTKAAELLVRRTRLRLKGLLLSTLALVTLTLASQPLGVTGPALRHRCSCHVTPRPGGPPAPAG